MFCQTAAATVIVFATIAPSHAVASDSDPIATDGIYATTGPQDECELVEGLSWDADTDDCITSIFLDRY